MSTYSQINYKVMLDTKHQYVTDPELQEAVYISKSRQYIALHEENIDQPKADDTSTKYVVTETQNLPMSSVIICSLLHDVCKHDNYYIGSNGKPTLDRKAKAKGHGRRSLVKD